MKKLCDEPVSEKELKRAKQYITGRQALRLETSDRVAGFYGEQEVRRMKIKTPAEVAADIRAVSAKDIQRVARKIFKKEKLNLAIVGPFKNKKQFTSLLKL